ncbi:hypothetical protein [Zhenhengia yiwuensis]|uniref:hypothetical protein n=1 Tax=Zhenhengia yiwuensis TaxID=2763666 RepID=UPI002A762344|nr:hypothetical protein [Zhenhengia yiwuensis]MBS5800846.1 hypothetical protein [Clostridiales bacterium]MDY3367458.1 hypothetical protein [Zhenhengia yiwuensis]
MGLKQIYNFIARLNKRDNPYTIVDEQVILTEGKWEGFLAHDQVIEKTIEIYTLPNKEGERVFAYTLDKKEEVWKTYLKVFSQSEVLYITYETYGDTVEAEDINQLQGAAYYLENFIENVKNKLHSHDEDKVRHITGKERESWNSRAFQKDLEVTNQNLQMTNENLEATNQNLGLTQQELLSHKNAKDNPHAVTKHQVGLGNVEDIQQASKAEFILHKEDLSNPHQVTKAQVGLGNLDNIQQASKVEFNTHTTDNIKHITSSERNNWNDKYTKAEVDNKLASLETKIDWKESVATFEDIASTYPNPVDGWTVNVKDTDYTYRYNGTEWVVISANAIPKATSQVDGLMAKEDKTNLEDMNNKKHTHSNKSLIDTLTQVLINNWNSAFTHISDAIKHITATERTLWNTVSNKVDKVSGKGLSTEDYTTAEKSKLSSIEANANRYVHPNDAGTRHVTDAEKTIWNGKANASHGNHVPATQSANNKKFLRCDNTWQDVTPGNIGAAALEHNHDSRYYTESEANAKFVSKEDLGAAGYGDMTKAIYDTNNSGIVDKAESVAWDGITGKPPTFPPSAHTHTKSQISDFPTSLPANGGNADTVDGLHASSFTRVHSGSVNFGGNNKEITTAEFKTLLTTMGAFKQPHWIARGSWSYATNQIITDSGFGKIHLAGCVVEVIGTSSAYTIRISTPTTASGGSSSTLNCEFMYVDNGTSYSPRWSKIWTSNNDGGGSGMDADTVDGKHASDFLPKKGLTWNDLKGV